MSDEEMDVEEDVQASSSKRIEEDADVVTDLSSEEVVTKYKTASDIVNKALTGVISFVKPDANIADLCLIGDTVIQKQCEAVYKTAKFERGIAFPTCISVNNCVCHFSPLPTESFKLKAGDIVKIDLGAQLDGYVAVAAHTMVCPGASGPVTGRTADVVQAAYNAAEAALRLIKPGNTNAQVTEMLADVAKSYGVSNVQGVLMHQMKRFVIDGNNVIIAREEVDQKVETFEFEENQVYTIDVVMSTGDGKPIQREARTTVYKRAVDQQYMLKLKASRYVLNEMNRRFSTFPFSLRALDEKQARLGVSELVKHNLVVSYPVLFEKQDAIVAHFKFTVLVLPSGANKATGAVFDSASIVSDKIPSEAVKALLATSVGKKKKKKSKKAKAGAAAGAAAEDEEMDGDE